MTLNQFISDFDKEGTIVLLEGKRMVAEHETKKLFELGRLLASKTNHIVFRSGNAEGADELFSKGVTEINPNRLQVITPYARHRRKDNVGGYTISLDAIDLAEEPEIVYHSKANKKNERIIEKYAAGERNRNAIKAAYLIRDTIKAIGTHSIKPTSLGIFYDDLDKPRQGGTGHTMNVCMTNGIPIIDQTVWLNWLE